MEFSQEPIPEERSELSIQRHGPDTPFRSHKVIQKWIQGLLERKGYEDFVEYNTTVEKAEKLGKTGSWRLTLRRAGPSQKRDYWWTEDFDAVVVANGHFTVPYVPEIRGLAEFAQAYPGSVEHSKGYRGPEKYREKVNSWRELRNLRTQFANILIESRGSRRFSFSSGHCRGHCGSRTNSRQRGRTWSL